MTVFQLKQWWKYRRVAKGRHGVHSPFVYRLVAEGLKARVPDAARKELHDISRSSREYGQVSTIYRTLKHLRVDTLEWSGPKELEVVIAGLCHAAAVRHWNRHISKGVQGRADAVLVGGSVEERAAVFTDCTGLLKEGTVFVVPDIHASPMHALQWQWMKEDKGVNLSLDLWYAGLLFYNPDIKERQHFVLKHWV
jgi:hypothetical protein